MKKKLVITIGVFSLLILLFTNFSMAYAASNPFTWGWCTWYAWQRTYDKLGIDLPCWGNAKDWATEAQNAGWTVDSTAMADSIAVWTSSPYIDEDGIRRDYGHVAYVENVEDGKIYISEMNFNGGFGVISEGYFDTSTGYWKGTSNDSTHYKRNFPVYYIHIRTGPGPDAVDVLSGVYVIHSAADYNMCLDIIGNSTENNAYVQMYHREADLDVQKFRVIKWGDGYYHISSIHNGRLLDVETPIENRARVKLYYESGKDFEEDFWYFEDAGNGYVRIKNKIGGYLDIRGYDPVDHAIIQVYQYEDHPCQMWLLEDVTDYCTIDNGTYKIHSAIDNNYVFDIYENQTGNRANIQLYETLDTKVQLFTFTKEGSYYVIKSEYANKWLDIRTPIENKSNVQLWESRNSAEEHWVLEDAGNGYFYIRSNADYYLDVEYDQAKNNANIQVYRFVGNNSQKWKLEKIEYKVTYDANGGIESPATQTKAYGEALTLSSDRPKRDGYDFLGWATTSSATSATYQPGGTYTQNANVTLYAVWRKLPDPVSVQPGIYVIHSAIDDAYCLDITDSSTENNANIQLYQREDTNVQKFRVLQGVDGYSFIQSVYNGRWLDIKTPIEDNSNVKLYDTNTGEENLWGFEDAEDGYVFIRSKTGYYLDIQGDRASNNANIQIYHFAGNNSQRWRLENVTAYTVAYDANGGENPPTSQTKTHGQALTLSTTTPTRDGYSFQGWATSASATTAAYQPGDSYTTDSDMTFYAVWKQQQIIIYSLTYDANGGKNAPPPQTKTHGSPIRLSSDIPTREGYIFQGWATSASASTAVYQPGARYTEDKNMTLYAVWIAPDFILPTSLKTIEAEAFTGCNFKYVQLPENVTAIGDKAFANCTNLRYIYIPEKCTSIAADAFDGTDGLTILGKGNSYAETYAEQYGITFKVID